MKIKTPYLQLLCALLLVGFQAPSMGATALVPTPLDVGPEEFPAITSIEVSRRAAQLALLGQAALVPQPRRGSDGSCGSEMPSLASHGSKISTPGRTEAALMGGLPKPSPKTAENPIVTLCKLFRQGPHSEYYAPYFEQVGPNGDYVYIPAPSLHQTRSIEGVTLLDTFLLGRDCQLKKEMSLEVYEVNRLNELVMVERKPSASTQRRMSLKEQRRPSIAPERGSEFPLDFSWTGLKPFSQFQRPQNLQGERATKGVGFRYLAHNKYEAFKDLPRMSKIYLFPQILVALERLEAMNRYVPLKYFDEKHMKVFETPDFTDSNVLFTHTKNLSSKGEHPPQTTIHLAQFAYQLFIEAANDLLRDGEPIVPLNDNIFITGEEQDKYAFINLLKHQLETIDQKLIEAHGKHIFPILKGMGSIIPRMYSLAEKNESLSYQKFLEDLMGSLREIELDEETEKILSYLEADGDGVDPLSFSMSGFSPISASPNVTRNATDLWRLTRDRIHRLKDPETVLEDGKSGRALWLQEGKGELVGSGANAEVRSAVFSPSIGTSVKGVRKITKRRHRSRRNSLAMSAFLETPEVKVEREQEHMRKMQRAGCSVPHSFLEKASEDETTGGSSERTIYMEKAVMSLEDFIKKFREHDSAFRHRYTFSYIQGLLKVYDCMKAEGLVHRDLKPANFLISRHHELLLTDWGESEDLRTLKEPKSLILDEDRVREPRELYEELVLLASLGDFDDIKVLMDPKELEALRAKLTSLGPETPLSSLEELYGSDLVLKLRAIKEKTESSYGVDFRYSSPQLLRSDKDTVRNIYDEELYSVFASAYHMIFGEFLYEGLEERSEILVMKDKEVYEAHLNNRLTALREKYAGDEHHLELVELFRQALAYEPKERMNRATFEKEIAAIFEKHGFVPRTVVPLPAVTSSSPTMASPSAHRPSPVASPVHLAPGPLLSPVSSPARKTRPRRPRKVLEDAKAARQSTSFQERMATIRESLLHGDRGERPTLPPPVFAPQAGGPTLPAPILTRSRSKVPRGRKSTPPARAPHLRERGSGVEASRVRRAAKSHQRSLEERASELLDMPTPAPGPTPAAASGDRMSRRPPKTRPARRASVSVGEKLPEMDPQVHHHVTEGPPRRGGGSIAAPASPLRGSLRPRC